jgi:hypothetical protein
MSESERKGKGRKGKKGEERGELRDESIDRGVVGMCDEISRFRNGDLRKIRKTSFLLIISSSKDDEREEEEEEKEEEERREEVEEEKEEEEEEGERGREGVWCLLADK